MVPDSAVSKDRNQTSSPFGLQLSDVSSPVVLCPETTPSGVRFPLLSTTMSWMLDPLAYLAYTTRPPSGEMRIISCGHSILSTSTLPIGYSSRVTLSTDRKTAIDEPSGDQSAAKTPSSKGRICPPDSDETESVYRLVKASCCVLETASRLKSSGNSK